MPPTSETRQPVSSGVTTPSTEGGLTPWPPDVTQHYRDAGYWTGDVLGALPSAWAASFGDRIAVVAGSDRWTYDHLDMYAARLAAGFAAMGIRPGDRVAVQLPNVAEFVAVLFGLFRCGAVPVIVLPAYRRSEVVHFCRSAEVVAYIVVDRHGGFDFRNLAREVRADVPELRHVIVVGDGEEFVRLAECVGDPDGYTAPAVDSGGMALLHLSGGTTGPPKLIPRTHDDYLYGARAGALLCRFSSETVYLCSLPAAHQFSLSAPGVLGTLLSGGRVVLGPHPAPDAAFPLIEREGVTVAAVVPPVAALWLDAATRTAHDLSSLQLLQVGGARLDAAAARRVRPVLGCQVQQVFGMTEGLLNFTRLDDPDELVCTTQGRPLSPADEIRVVDDDDRDVAGGEPGHLLVRGPNTIRGYVGAPAHNETAFTSDGFYRTGDIVRRLDTGHLVVVGRVKDQINRGGEKVSADEVESHLRAHDDVADSAVVAMPDEFLGERVCAYVVPQGTPPAPAELIDFVRRRGLAAYKVPDRVEFVDDLPRTAVGKISKQALRERIAAAVASAHGGRVS